MDNKHNISNFHINNTPAKPSDQFNIFDYIYKPIHCIKQNHEPTLYHQHTTLSSHLSSPLYTQIITLLMLLFDDMQYSLIHPHPNHDIQQTYNYILYSLNQLSQTHPNNPFILSLISILQLDHNPKSLHNTHPSNHTPHTQIHPDIFEIICLSLPNNNYLEYLYLLQSHILSIQSTLSSHQNTIIPHPSFLQTIHIYHHTISLLHLIAYQEFYEGFLSV